VVEFACLLAMRPRVVLLDEPMAGIAQREAEAFGPLLLDVREALGASMIVIEARHAARHLHQRPACNASRAGAVISTGTPDEVRNDPAVISSYLGNRCIGRIERSGAGRPAANGPRREAHAAQAVPSRSSARGAS